MLCGLDKTHTKHTLSYFTHAARSISTQRRGNANDGPRREHEIHPAATTGSDHITALHTQIKDRRAEQHYCSESGIRLNPSHLIKHTGITACAGNVNEQLAWKKRLCCSFVLVLCTVRHIWTFTTSYDLLVVFSITVTISRSFTCRHLKSTRNKNSPFRFDCQRDAGKAKLQLFWCNNPFLTL